MDNNIDSLIAKVLNLHQDEEIVVKDNVKNEVGLEILNQYLKIRLPGFISIDYENDDYHASYFGNIFVQFNPIPNFYKSSKMWLKFLDGNNVKGYNFKTNKIDLLNGILAATKYSDLYIDVSDFKSCYRDSKYFNGDQYFRLFDKGMILQSLIDFINNENKQN